MCDSAKAVFTEKFIALNACIRKEERSEINNFKTPPSETRKKKQSIRKEIKITAKTKEIENRKPESTKSKTGFGKDKYQFYLCAV